MNRADLLLSVLRDGREHSRGDIVREVGYFLTNNAASELRARGVPVEHRVQAGLHTYRLLNAATGAVATPAAPSSIPLEVAALSCPVPSVATLALDGFSDGVADGQLSLSVPRGAYE